MLYGGKHLRRWFMAGIHATLLGYIARPASMNPRRRSGLTAISACHLRDWSLLRLRAVEPTRRSASSLHRLLPGFPSAQHFVYWHGGLYFHIYATS
jgi:hypothetical protein